MPQARSVYFDWPRGEAFDPSPDEVFAVMNLPDEGNWGYQPVCEMNWYDPARPPDTTGRKAPSAQMILIRHPERGWYFEYSSKGRWLGSLTAGGPPGHVRHWSWGEEENFRAASFVPADVAQRVVADFMATGRPSAVVGWAGVEEAGTRLRDDQLPR